MPRSLPRLAVLSALCLSGCMGNIEASGSHLNGAAPADLLGLSTAIPIPPIGVLVDAASATAISPGIAVTAGHAAGVATTGFSTRWAPLLDLAFFKTDKGTALPIADPVQGEAVTAYGNSLLGGFRVAHGAVLVTHMHITHPNGEDVGDGFAFDAPLGGGFSGGPVLNAKGELVGVTTYLITITNGNLKGHAAAFAYRATDVLREEANLFPQHVALVPIH